MENTTRLSIKGMVCNRCIQVVNREFEKLGLEIIGIKLGVVELSGLAESTLEKIESILSENGLELIYTKEQRMIKDIKKIIEDQLSQTQILPAKNKISDVLCSALPYSYDYLSEIFSSNEGVTLERYIINKRLEKVKELLVYSRLTLTEIAYVTGFSSVHHLSNQFKEQTGLPPSHFRAIRSDKQEIIKRSK